MKIIYVPDDDPRNPEHDGWVGVRHGVIPTIFIRERASGNLALISHEEEHIKQAWRGLIVFHWIGYKYSKSYRYDCEIAAYRAQLQHYHGVVRREKAKAFVDFIGTRYGLDVDYQQALIDLGE